MKGIFSSRRNKSPHHNEESENRTAPFFGKESKTPFFNATGAIQTKLTIGQAGDKYEQEADSMADAIVNKTTVKPDIQNKEISGIQRESLATPLEDEKLGAAEQRMEEDKLVQEKPEIQKMGIEEEEEGMVNKMAGEEAEEEEVQTKSSGNARTAGTGLTQQLRSKSGRGKGLPQNTKAEMESSFGNDFSEVNIHTDQEAITMNKELGAQAFTHGKDVYFNSGKYNPETTEGKHLLAHELTHVVQQQGGTDKIQNKLRVEDEYPTKYVKDQMKDFGVHKLNAKDPSLALSNQERHNLVKGQLEKLSPHFSVQGSGNVTQKGKKTENELAKDKKGVASCCLHVLSRKKTTNDWKIVVADHLFPQTHRPKNTVLINSNLSPLELGYHNKAGERLSYGNNPELVLAHELCGHAALGELDVEAEGDRAVTDVHDSTIKLENEIAEGLDRPEDKLRGLSSDKPHKGESFGHSEVINFGFNKFYVAHLEDSEKDKLKLISDVVRAHDLFVELRGHSDNVGSEGAKQQISELRAGDVRTFLLNLGVSPTATVEVGDGKEIQINRFLKKGMSDKEPLPGIDPITEQHKLRRVDVIVTSFPSGLSELPPGVTKSQIEQLNKLEKVKEPEKVQDFIDKGTPCEKLLVEKAYRNP